MKKEELLEMIQKDLKSSGINLTKLQVNEVFSVVFKNVGNEISIGKNLTIMDFGKFESRYISRRKNFLENGTKKIWEIKFIPSKFLKTKINM